MHLQRGLRVASDGPVGPGDREEEDVPVPPSVTRSEISGTVYGPAVQARDIHGNVFLHQRVSRLPSPSQLPPPVRLAGRTDALAAMDAARASRLIVLTGPPGIGKTSPAVRSMKISTVTRPMARQSPVRRSAAFCVPSVLRHIRCRPNWPNSPPCTGRWSSTSRCLWSWTTRLPRLRSTRLFRLRPVASLWYQADGA